MRTHRSIPRAVFFLLAVQLCGCGTLGSLFGSGINFGGTRGVEVFISEELNQNSPVAFEMLIVYSKALDKELMALTASDWFAKRAQYLRDFPTSDLVSYRWEWVPAQTVQRKEFDYRAGALAAIIFVSYASPGDHRVRVEPPNQDLRVVLEDDDFRVEVL